VDIITSLGGSVLSIHLTPIQLILHSYTVQVYSIFIIFQDLLRTSVVNLDQVWRAVECGRI